LGLGSVGGVVVNDHCTAGGSDQRFEVGQTAFQSIGLGLASGVGTARAVEDGRTLVLASGDGGFLAIAEGLRPTALPFAVSALAQKAAIASLDAGEEMAARVSLVKQERSRMAAELEAQGWALQPSEGNFLWIRADAPFLALLVDVFDAAGITVRAYQGDGVRITVADPASNNRVLRLLAAHTPFATS
jgi:hypothetical protein